jgi:hypothetical protein
MEKKMLPLAAKAVTLPTFGPAFAYKTADAVAAPLTAVPGHNVEAALNGKPPQTTFAPPEINLIGDPFVNVGTLPVG